METETIKKKLIKIQAGLLIAQYEMLDLTARLKYGCIFSHLSKSEKNEIALEVAKRNE